MKEIKSPQLNYAPFGLEGRRTLLLADGEFSVFGAKTAVCYLRYRTSDVVAVVDATRTGRTVQQAVGFGGDIPIVASVDEAMAHEPEVAIVGVAPQGGRFDRQLHAQVMACVERGIDVASGLHDFLEDDHEITTAAVRSGARLWDVRAVPEGQVVASGNGCVTGAKSVLVVGSDCNVGKMTAALELYNHAVTKNIKAAWAATGQTGMMLRARGIAVDRVIADFVGGASESLVNYEGHGQDVVIVEGQGSLVHPGYAGVTLGLLYGVMPDCMVMVHAAERATIGHTAFVMPSLGSVIAMYEAALTPFKKSRVVAVALNTAGLADAAARDMIEKTAREVGLPTADPVRDGAATILDAVVEGLRMQEGNKR
jgi:uncharacterized NAD-dependent epimerase/dehydratase family protein